MGQNITWKSVGGALPTEHLPSHPPPPATDENKSTKTSAWGGKVANLSQRRRALSLFLSGLLLGSFARNTGKAHQ